MLFSHSVRRLPAGNLSRTFLKGSVESQGRNKIVLTLSI